MVSTQIASSEIYEI
ncbi:unnamed protein product, partial [Rotaria sp. Silwood2]